ncbi:HER174Cp [Eremothecium sinecaudum]|uniref:HER174Cp n=1 Tax=Eremothecium sinecaudum TaxID=45286 RepID=A0A120K2G3_9SACH|nr:HER174Cp [Eremothecium sinecaudum]AMD21453.1 HER174Cp [Eremothecium sinecaudum]
MKFSHSLQFNAVPEWTSKYIAYSQLKKLTYKLQKEKLYHGNSVAEGSEVALLVENFEKPFIDALDKELRKIDKFFNSQETGILANFQEFRDDFEELQFEVQMRALDAGKLNGSAVSFTRSDVDETVEDHNDMERGSYNLGSSNVLQDILLPLTRDTMYTSQEALLEQQVAFKKRVAVLFTRLSELKSYIELNKTGFSKICKKFDKSLESNVRDWYMESLPKRTHVFAPETIEKIDACIKQTVAIYAQLMGGSSPGVAIDTVNDQTKLHEAERELSVQLRDYVVWERNTVWKDMMNLERKAQNAKTKPIQEHTLESAQDGSLNNFMHSDAKLAIVPSNYLRLIVRSPRFLKFLGISLIFLVLLVVLPVEDILQKNCLAILIYASLLWATEAIPLFVTSLMLPLLIVTFPVIRDPVTSTAMTATKASHYILSSMWSSVIMLLLGGFTLASALSKYNIAKVLSTHVLASAGTEPKAVLLTTMFLATFTSMWVSNVAAPVLCYSIVQPLLRTMPKGSHFGKSLILGIALASNIGGMASPIASPQNIFAIGVMDPTPSWFQWFLVSIPVCLLSVLAIWLFLLVTFPRDRNLKLLRLHPIDEPFSVQQWYIVFVTVLTILLWCLGSKLSSVFGEMGIISIVPMLLLFGTGLLDSDDFNNFMWTIVILAMGGTCLGRAVSSSGLLESAALVIKNHLESSSIFTIVLISGAGIVTMATFVSHTVAAIIIVPLMKELGSNLAGSDHSRLLVMTTALLCSAGMGLPTSGFPNVTAISMIDDLGDRYLDVGAFIKRGVPASILTYFIVITVGFLMMSISRF